MPAPSAAGGPPGERLRAAATLGASGGTAAEGAMTQRIRRTAAELEQAFAQEVSLERQRRHSLLHSAERRSRRRRRERTHRHGRLRFFALVITLALTAVLVTVAMFATLYLALR